MHLIQIYTVLMNLFDRAYVVRRSILKGQFCLFFLAICLTGTAYAFPHKYVPRPTPTATSVPPVIIGVILPMTGPDAPAGAQAMAAITMAVTKINASGGAGGFQLRTIVEDSAAKGVTPGEIIAGLVSDHHADVLLGDLDAEKSSALAELANTYRVPLLSPSLVAHSLTPDNHFAFSLYPVPSTLNDAMTKFLKMPGVKTPIVVFCDNNALGSANTEAFREAVLDAHLLIKDEVCSSSKSPDYRVDVMRAQADEPGAVFISRHAAALIPWMKSVGLNVPALSSADLSDFAALNSQPLEPFEGMYIALWPINEIFSATFKSANSGSPQFESALAYDGIQIIAAALNASPMSLTAGLRKVRQLGVAGSYDFSSEQAGNSSSAMLYRIQHGDVVLVP